jgi:hypothetical protein
MSANEVARLECDGAAREVTLSINGGPFGMDVVAPMGVHSIDWAEIRTTPRGLQIVVRLVSKVAVPAPVGPFG